MHYIDNLNEYERRVINESLFLSKKTGNLVASMLGTDERAGKEIFKTINANVDALEKIIDDYNNKHKVKVGNSPLEVKIDKNKLELEYLLSMTKVKRTSFISDIIVANILNYKILIRPIKNAKIITLAYRYYLAMIRHTLQSALVTIEISSDLFFSQINMNLAGRRRQMKEMSEMLINQTKSMMTSFLMGTSFIDDKGRTRKIQDVVGVKQAEQIAKLLKTLKTTNDSFNSYDRSMGYNQNVFQESSRTIESLLKSNQDKELQSIAEQFTNIANATTGLSKDDRADAREQVSNYAAAVKLSTERRAMEVCQQINMNMLDILKIFTIRNIDGFSEAFEEGNELEKKKLEYEKERDALYTNLQNAIAQNESDCNKRIEEITGKFSDEQKEQILQGYKKKGLDDLCSEKELHDVVYDNKDMRYLLVHKYKFSPQQASDILDSTGKIADYDKVFYGDMRDYCKKHDDIDFKDNKKKDDDDLYAWMRIKDKKYQKIKEEENNN